MVSQRTQQPTTTQALLEQQDSLRRIATIVARGLPPAEVFDAIAHEIAHCLGTDHAVLHRHDPASNTTVLVASHDHPGIQTRPLGARYTLEGENVNSLVMRTGRPARIDDYDAVSGVTADRLRALGIRSAVGVPIIDDGRLWGTAIVASPQSNSMSSDIEARLAGFASLVAPSITNVETRAELLASREQQAALRRVATLVARGCAGPEVFDAVANEAARSVNADSASLVRFEEAGTFLVLATCDKEGALPLPLGQRFALGGDDVASLIHRTGRPARMDTHAGAAGAPAARVREIGIRSGVGAPIVVAGKHWGAIMVGLMSSDPFASDTEERIAEFSELIATAIANAEARAELAASRRRLITAGDEARRRLERDLHDGAQQRLVSLALEMRILETSMSTATPELRRQMSAVISGLLEVTHDLQELSRGIHPAILSQGGLDVALRILGRRSTVPVEVDVELTHPLAKSVEVAAYYFVAEGLTNVTKYARARNVWLTAHTNESTLTVSVRDDGVGGANAKLGSGLIGLTDRIEALGGHLIVISHHGHGTQLRATIPLNHD